MNTLPTILFVESNAEELKASFDNRRLPMKCNVDYISTIETLSDCLLQNTPDIIFLDVTFNGAENGMQLYKKLDETLSSLLIAVVPETDPQIRTEVLNLNPFFYISKPYDNTEIQFAIKRAIDRLIHISGDDKAQADLHEYCGIIGRSEKMKNLFDLIGRVAEDDFSTVLIRGESGTGKELVAKAIHTKSKRGSKNFVPVNCAAIPDDLLESELFGHTKGAFTGATQSKQGRIQYADGGTLFLDEIGDMKPTLQAKLLRVIQEKEFEPVGGLKATPVDTRILAATHCDLEQLVQEGQFREDLYYRLSVIPMNIPPLKTRKEDIPLLINAFIDRYTTDRGRERFKFSADAMEKLLQYNWRGNVRELENLIQHMSILYSGKIIEVADLPEKYLLEENITDEDISVYLENYRDQVDKDSSQSLNVSPQEVDGETQEIDFNEVINEFETKLIVNAMRASGGNKKEAARLLNLKRTTLLEKIKKKRINPENW